MSSGPTQEKNGPAGQVEWAQAKLRELVAIRSETGHEAEILAYLERDLAGYGLPLERQQVERGRYNLLFNPLPCPDLVVDAHVDTVAVTLQESTCPMKEEGTLLYGRGACDDKGSVVAVLAALRSFFPLPSQTSFPITIAFTVDEEDKAIGSEVLSKSMRPKAALVMEPTKLALCPAEGGYQRVRLRTRGVPVHGSCFRDGQNACEALMRALAKLPSLSFLEYSHSLLGPAGYNLCYIQGGEPGLIVPESCEAVVDFVLLPGMEVKAVRAEVAAFWEREGLEGEFIEEALPYALKGDEAIIDLCRSAFKQALGREPEIAGMKSWTNAENFYSAGVPAVVWGPGDVVVGHTPREHIDVKEIVTAARCLEAMWRQLAGPGK